MMEKDKKEKKANFIEMEIYPTDIPEKKNNTKKGKASKTDPNQELIRGSKYSKL